MISNGYYQNVVICMEIDDSGTSTNFSSDYCAKKDHVTVHRIQLCVSFMFLIRLQSMGWKLLMLELLRLCMMGHGDGTETAWICIRNAFQQGLSLMVLFLWTLVLLICLGLAIKQICLM